MTDDVQPRQAARVPDIAISLIRTWVPMAVGGVLTWAASAHGFVVPADASVTVGIGATAACAAAYYGLARAFEAVRGSGAFARGARGVGRYMLGGLVSKPIYLTDDEYARLVAASAAETLTRLRARKIEGHRGSTPMALALSELPVAVAALRTPERFPPVSRLNVTRIVARSRS